MLLHILPQRHIKKLVAVAFLTVAAFSFSSIPVTAQEVVPTADNTKPVAPLSISTSNIKGLEVSPFLLELDVAKGGTIQSEVNLTNRSTEPLYINTTPRDFLPGEEGQPQFIPDPGQNDITFSLSSWVELNNFSRFIIQPGETIKVPFTVNPPKDAEQGTHYGALLFSYAGKSSEGSSSEVQQSIGTILLVYYGQARENGTVELSTNKKIFWNSDKVDFQNKFINSGNVHVKPKGEIHIKNIFGRESSNVFINRDAANVLPKSDRTFVSTWYPTNFAFGRYTAESIVSYGRGKLEARSEIVIWVLPIYYVIALGALIVFLLWVIFHGRHIHKRRVIRKHLEKQNSDVSK
jgi:hypothetical protein